MIETIILSVTTFVGLLFAGIGWFIKHNFDNIETKLDKIDTRTSDIDRRVASIEGRFGVAYTASASPVKLTEKGEELLKKSGAKVILDKEENKKTIISKIKAEPKPTNAYDVQEKTRKVIEEMANTPMFLPLKDYAFNEGMELEVILNVVSIYFRDCALSELGFKVEDLD